MTSILNCLNASWSRLSNVAQIQMGINKTEVLLSIKHKLNRCLWTFCLCLLGFALSTAVAVAPLAHRPGNTFWDLSSGKLYTCGFAGQSCPLTHIVRIIPENSQWENKMNGNVISRSNIYGKSLLFISLTGMWLTVDQKSPLCGMNWEKKRV